VLTPERIPQAERDLAAAFSGPLGPFEVTAHEVDIPVEEDLALSTAIYRPETNKAVPAILVRSAYAKALLRTEGTFWASHGYGLVVQDTRGPASYFYEAADGEATVKWIQSQDWFNGRLGLHGISYLGFTAWATASRCRNEVDAISVAYFSSDRTSSWYPGGSLGLDVALEWSVNQHKDESDPAAEGISLEAYMHLPLIEADVVQTGRQIPFYRERLTYRGDDPHWTPLDFSGVLSEGCPPTLLFGGWYDYQRRFLWEDSRRLEQAGVTHRLVMGPWMHGGGWAELNAEVLRWFDTHVKKQDALVQSPISFFVTGGDTWKESAGQLDSDTDSIRWYLAPHGSLTTTAIGDSDQTRFTYDPMEPTPSVGLASFDATRALPCDNRELESRTDVVTFTSDPFDKPVSLFGPVRATIWVKSSAKSADFFVRITDVHPDGASYNVIDALRRVEDDDRLYTGDEPMKLEIALGPCAHHFDARHQLRVQISSGAFPFYVRNLGTGEDIATGTRFTAADQILFHDSQYPAHIIVTVDSATS
jgi:hypothetical protein